MSHRALLEYISAAKSCGVGDDEIHERLQKAGWYNVDIRDALELYEKIASPAPAICDVMPPTPKPSMTRKLIPASYDPYLALVASISFILGFFGFIWLTHY